MELFILKSAIHISLLQPVLNDILFRENLLSIGLTATHVSQNTKFFIKILINYNYANDI